MKSDKLSGIDLTQTCNSFVLFFSSLLACCLFVCLFVCTAVSFDKQNMCLSNYCVRSANVILCLNKVHTNYVFKGNTLTEKSRFFSSEDTYTVNRA